MNDRNEVNTMPRRAKNDLSSEPIPGADFKPVELIQITTLEQLRAISDPLRVEIIEIIMREALTVKQMADRLNQPATKLYYHVSELESAGFVTLVGTRVKSGIVEKYYRTAADSIQVDRSLLNGSAGAEESLGLLITTVFDTTIADLTRSFKSGNLNLTGDAANPQDKQLMLTHDLCRLHRADVPLFIDKFKSLLAEMDVKGEGEDIVSYACTIAFYPHTEPGQEVIGKE
jgi:DNA-binding transcriptional ArsR family regulator